MGRSLPPSPYESHPHLHPIISLSFIALSIAASIAILSALCASCHRKSEKSSEETKSAPTSPQTNGSVDKKPEDRPALDATTEVSEDHPSQEAEKAVVVLDVSLHGPIVPTGMHSESSKRKSTSTSLSMKLPDGLSRIRTGRKDKAAAEETDDTLWTKTIILGEKCRLPSEEEEAADGGQKSYHPRTPRSLPVSRNNSFFNPDVVAAVAEAAN